MLKLAVAGLLIAGVVSTEALAGDIGRIKTVSGQATIIRGASTYSAVAGASLNAKDVLATGRDGRIGVSFIDNSRFAVGPNSRVSLAEFEFDDTTHKGHSLTQVDRGSLAVVSGQIAHENKDAMKVRTPTSLLAARGTRFVVSVP
ncbi:MAG: FecR domain-containing protein [Proteobacteria bacterium]|nr:FecR domain-containing protein [Pseudomonadota bacterium]